jgi:hypothetical protein
MLAKPELEVLKLRYLVTRRVSEGKKPVARPPSLTRRATIFAGKATMRNFKNWKLGWRIARRSCRAHRSRPLQALENHRDGWVIVPVVLLRLIAMCAK